MVSISIIIEKHNEYKMFKNCRVEIGGAFNCCSCHAQPHVEVKNNKFSHASKYGESTHLFITIIIN